MAGPSHGGLWGSSFDKHFLNAPEQSESESINEDGKIMSDESDDCIKDNNKSVDSVISNFVIERNWLAVFETLSQTLKAEAEPGHPLPRRHPWLYLILYKEHIIDLMLQNKKADAHKFYTENVHHMTAFANSGFAVSSVVQEIVREIFEIEKNLIKYEPTENGEMRDQVDFYLRLYCSEIVGHNTQPGMTKSHLWQFVIRIPKSKPDQRNPSFRCLACGMTFKNCTISKYREHMTEDRDKGNKRKKFPVCKMITMNMKLRYSLGEREQKNPDSSKSAQSVDNAQCPQQDLAREEIVPIKEMSKRRGISKESGGQNAEGEAPELLRHEASGGKRKITLGIDNAQCPQQALARQEIVPTKEMSKGRGISKESREKNAEGGAPELLTHQASGGKRKRADELLESDMQEKKRHSIAKGSDDQYPEGSALSHLVTGVRSNVAGFNKLFGDKQYTLAVRSDLDVARDMLCTMTGIEAENDLVSRAELIYEGTSRDRQTIPSNTEGLVEEGTGIHDLATLVRQSVSFLFRFYKKEKFTKEVKRELLEANSLLSRMLSCQKK